jgi:hypothetical protein
MASQPLSGLRLAVTLPPAHFFSGCDLAIARDHVFALRQLGAVVYEFDTTHAYMGSKSELRTQLDDLRSFQPDAAIGAPHAGYAVQPFVARRRDQGGDTALGHLFLDELDLPTLLYWDHALLQLPKYLVSPWPGGPGKSRKGVLARLGSLFRHPRAIHFFPDSGHIPELHALGIAEFPPDSCYIPGISHQYVEYGESDRDPSEQGREVAFFGNIYIAAARKITYADETLLAVRRQAFERLKADWDCAPYDAYREEIECLSAAQRSELRLRPDESFYWRFLFDELSVVANGERRLQVALECGRPLTYFGGFADPETRAIVSSAGCTLAEEYLPYGRPLAAAYERQALSIDVANAPYINGFSTKLFSCFAAGGFMLTSRKADLAGALGDLAEAITFSSAEELSAKASHFLDADHERRDLTLQIQAVIREKFTASALYARTVPKALSALKGREQPRASKDAPSQCP